MKILLLAACGQWLRRVGCGLSFLLIIAPVWAQTVTITSGQNIGGPYTNLTIARGGTGTMTGNVFVTGTLRVEDGGALATGEWLVGGNAFELQAGATLIIGDAFGIMAAGSTSPNRGCIVTTSRSFSPDANYIYNAAIRFQAAPVVQRTGSGLPARVRSLVANVVNIQGTPGNNILALENDVSVTELLGSSNGSSIDPALLSGPARTLTLLSDPARGTALMAARGLFGVSGPLVTQPIVIQRSIEPSLNAGLGYRHLASPVHDAATAQGVPVSMLTTAGFVPVVNPAYNTAAVPGSITPFPNVFGYDQSRLAGSPATGLSPFDQGWASPAAGSSPLEIGRGYTVNLPASSVISFRGVPNQEDVSLTLSRGAASDAGWQLLGNPFPSPLDWSLVAVPAGLDNAIYVYQSTAQYGGRYRAYVNGVGNPILPLGQGFFVRVGQPGSTVNLTLPVAAQVTVFGQEPPVQRPAETRPLLQLALAQGSGTLAEAYVYFEPGATAGADARYDAVRLPQDSGGPSVYSLAAGTEMLINGLPLPRSRTVVPLGMALPGAGTFTLQATQLLNLSGAGVYLHDAATGQDTDLHQQPRYSFTATGVTALNGRFSLRFEPQRPTASPAALDEARVRVYPNPVSQELTVQLPAVPGAGEVEATLLNTLGQVVRRHTAGLTVAGAHLVVGVRGLPAGVYVLRLQAGAEALTRRVVVE